MPLHRTQNGPVWLGLHPPGVPTEADFAAARGDQGRDPVAGAIGSFKIYEWIVAAIGRGYDDSRGAKINSELHASFLHFSRTAYQNEGINTDSTAFTAVQSLSG